jgi:hypothetical protein
MPVVEGGKLGRDGIVERSAGARMRSLEEERRRETVLRLRLPFGRGVPDVELSNNIGLF